MKSNKDADPSATDEPEESRSVDDVATADEARVRALAPVVKQGKANKPESISPKACNKSYE